MKEKRKSNLVFHIVRGYRLEPFPLPSSKKKG